MTELNEGFGNEGLPSVIKDPFSKEKVSRIYIFYQRSHFSHKWEATGTVEFENGDTKGEQKFSGDTFDSVVLKIRNLLDTL